jgi:hypothetical protein
MTTTGLPSPEAIRSRIDACRTEIRELKVLLRASEAARRAEEARERRRQNPLEGVQPCDR